MSTTSPDPARLSSIDARAVRAAAASLGLASTTVGRAYADLGREWNSRDPPRAGAAIAARDALDQPALGRIRRERIEVPARQIAVRALALGLDPAEVVETVVREFDLRGHPLDSVQAVAPVDDEPGLLSVRNRLRGTIACGCRLESRCSHTSKRRKLH